MVGLTIGKRSERVGEVLLAAGRRQWTCKIFWPCGNWSMASLYHSESIYRQMKLNVSLVDHEWRDGRDKA